MLLLLLSVAGVAGLTLLAFLLGFRAEPRLDEARARLEAARLPGFRARRVALARDGRSALVEGHGDALALVLPVGDRFIARAVAHDALEADAEGLLARLDEPLLRTARTSIVPPDWLERAA